MSYMFQEFKINALASREQRAKETTAGDTERTKNSRFQIFVGNLSSETDNKELKELAEQFGDVSYAFAKLFKFSAFIRSILLGK
jgi:RNA recognition motif-containing protein